MVSPGNANGEIQGDGVGRVDGNACEDRATEQVITHPHSSFHGQGVLLLGGVALAEQHPYQSTRLLGKRGRRSWDLLLCLLDLGILSLWPSS